ncbi:MAG: hypothetical protein WB696_28480 [Chthoniobacterales bacterium]
MTGNYYQILTALAPYAISAFFSLFIAVAWAMAFAKLKQFGALVLAVASLVGLTLTAASAAIWLSAMQGQRQLIPYLGIVSIVHTIVVGCLTISGAFLMAFHRPEKK